MMIGTALAEKPRCLAVLRASLIGAAAFGLLHAPDVFAAKGCIPYGDHATWMETHEDNGKCGGVWIGPEFGSGNVVADPSKDPVMIIKTAWGGKSLAADFRSPSSGKLIFQGKPEDEGQNYR